MDYAWIIDKKMCFSYDKYKNERIDHIETTLIMTI